jgi:SNF2 family DNA or RNA helicase
MYPNVMILSYQKHALGLNLQQYNTTIYFDKVWDYALRTQSINRTYRMGQSFDCEYYDLTGDVGLENLIDKNIAKKIGMVEYFKGKTKEELKTIL